MLYIFRTYKFTTYMFPLSFAYCLHRAIWILNIYRLDNLTQNLFLEISYCYYVSNAWYSKHPRSQHIWPHWVLRIFYNAQFDIWRSTDLIICKGNDCLETRHCYYAGRALYIQNLPVDNIHVFIWFACAVLTSSNLTFEDLQTWQCARTCLSWNSVSLLWWPRFIYSKPTSWQNTCFPLICLCIFSIGNLTFVDLQTR